jgi:hypothetical protein
MQWYKASVCFVANVVFWDGKTSQGILEAFNTTRAQKPPYRIPYQGARHPSWTRKRISPPGRSQLCAKLSCGFSTLLCATIFWCQSKSLVLRSLSSLRPLAPRSCNHRGLPNQEPWLHSIWRGLGAALAAIGTRLLVACIECSAFISRATIPLITDLAKVSK